MLQLQHAAQLMGIPVWSPRGNTRTILTRLPTCQLNMIKDGGVPIFPAEYSEGMFPSLWNPTEILKKKCLCVCLDVLSESLTSLTFQYWSSRVIYWTVFAFLLFNTCRMTQTKFSALSTQHFFLPSFPSYKYIQRQWLEMSGSGKWSCCFKKFATIPHVYTMHGLWSYPTSLLSYPPHTPVDSLLSNQLLPFFMHFSHVTVLCM